MELFSLKNGILISIKSTRLSTLERIINACRDLPYVAGFKVNSEITLINGLNDVISTAKKQTEKPLIFDHQKFGSDTPETYSGSLLDTIKASGVDGLVVFPLSGRIVLETIIDKCLKIDLLPIVSGDLSYTGYFNDEGGYIYSDTQQRIYLEAASIGVSHFMMSCNRLDRIKIYCHELGSIVGQLKIFFTSIDIAGCENLPDACSQIKQNRAFAVFEDSFVSEEKYVSDLGRFWESFSKKMKSL